MLFIGQIEALGRSAKIDRDKWIELIDSHLSLTHVPPVKGVNPFTRQPFVYSAPDSTAQIVVGRTTIGLMQWALDGSPFLQVHANDASVEDVVKVAEDIASMLGARFVRENGEE
jgi:hypothetical protein